MMKLKHLFNNKDLASMILNNWEYDRNDENLFEYFRISSTAVYWFINEGKRLFLRFVPADEKSKEALLAELDFLKYLRENNYSVPNTVLSKQGNELQVADTPWGTYYACVFTKAPGKPLEDVSPTNEITFGLGKSLGKLHKLSSEYKPSNNIRRPDLGHILDWCNSVLSKFPDETLAMDEVKLLKEYFSKLTITHDNYGLIHFDFDASDNVFYDEVTKIYTAIDFDDSMYSWYAMDVENAIDSIANYLPEDELESGIATFLEGYQSEFTISDEMLNAFPMFRRFENLYGYVRVIRSCEEKWDNEPDWMIDLRHKLDTLLSERNSNFGKPIQ